MANKSFRTLNVFGFIIGTKSNKIARDDAHVYKVTHALYMSSPFRCYVFYKNRSKIINVYCIKYSRVNYRGIDDFGH